MTLHARIVMDIERRIAKAGASQRFGSVQAIFPFPGIAAKFVFGHSVRRRAKEPLGIGMQLFIATRKFRIMRPESDFKARTGVIAGMMWIGMGFVAKRRFNGHIASERAIGHRYGDADIFGWGYNALIHDPDCIVVADHNFFEGSR